MKPRLRGPIRRRVRRKPLGVSLTELLVGSVLMGISLAVVAELMSLCVLANTKLFRQFDASTGIHFALERIKRDVRMAREVRGTLTLEERDSLGRNVTSSASVLILRLPIQFQSKSNDPTSELFDSAAPQHPFTGYTIPGYYLVLYEVLPDLQRPGEFKITTTSRRMPKDEVYQSGENKWFFEHASFKKDVTEQVIATGIVGPHATGAVDGSTPKIFSFIAKNPAQNGRLDLINDSMMWNELASRGVMGVGVDLELKRGELTEGSIANETAAIHSETMLRLPFSSSGPFSQELYEQ